MLAIAVPMTLANATTPLLGVVGTGGDRPLGEAHLLGAVAMSSVVFDCMFWLFAFLRMGTVALTAQALGAGDVGGGARRRWCARCWSRPRSALALIAAAGAARRASSTS